MPLITLRVQPGAQSENDLIVEVKDNTYQYLLSSDSPKIRVSAYLDRDWPRVEAQYAELFVSQDCPFVSKITRVTPGSRTRTGIKLPGPMSQGEQLTLEVSREPV